MKEQARAELEKRYNRLVGTSATNLCTHCGWCIESCHVYQATKDPAHSPVAKAEQVRKILKKKHDWLSKLFPFWTGASEITDETFDQWTDAAFKHCTLCERCVVNCPMAVETPQLLGAARGVLTALGKEPEILDQLTDAAISREENLDLMRGIYNKQIAKLEKQVQDHLQLESATIPLEKKAEILYVPLSGAHTIVPAAVVFNAANASWTMSMFEASNYGLFIGDVGRAKKIVQRILDEAKRLEVKKIVVTECGHAYGVLKWEAPKWFKGKFPYEVTSLLEIMDEYIQYEKLTVDKELNQTAVTYHDPCNMGRKGGIFEEPRDVLKATSIDYREMTPNRVENYCCGGGAGLVACSDWSESRLEFGKMKAEQIKATGAKSVVTACDNCLHQIQELGEMHDLGITVSNVSQWVMKAIPPVKKSQEVKEEVKIEAITT